MLVFVFVCIEFMNGLQLKKFQSMKWWWRYSSIDMIFLSYTKLMLSYLCNLACYLFVANSYTTSAHILYPAVKYCKL